MKRLDFIYYCILKGTYLNRIDLSISCGLSLYLLNVMIILVPLIGILVHISLQSLAYIIVGYGVATIFLIIYFSFYFSDEKGDAIREEYGEKGYTKKQLALYGYGFVFTPVLLLLLWFLLAVLIVPSGTAIE